MKKIELKVTPDELADLRIAVELRAQASEENSEVSASRRWRRLLRKIEGAAAR